MKQLPAVKLKWIIALIPFIIVSVACNFIDILNVGLSAFQERCTEVSRDRYVQLAGELGVTPQTPQYPESAVYEACYQDSKVVKVRMSEGYREENEDDEKIEKAENSDNSVAGTYIGEIETPPSWDRIQAEYVINVAEDGSVSGHKIHIYQTETDGPVCFRRHEVGHTVLFSGYISGNSGIVNVTSSSYNLRDDSDCKDGSVRNDVTEYVCDLSTITITGNELEIRVKSSDGNTYCQSGGYYATKQQP